MKEPPFFSIIIPTKNRIDHLHRAVHSVLNQSFNRCEVIVINDGDPEQLPVIEDLLAFIPLSSVYQNDQKGVSGARNKGAQYAIAHYLIFLDDDELFLETHLEKLYEIILAKNGKELIFKTGTLIEQAGIRKQEGTFTNDRSLSEQIWQYGASMSDFCLPVSVQDKVSFHLGLDIIEDFNYLMKALSFYPAYFTGAYTVLIPDHNQRISYRKFHRPYPYFSNEVLAVLDTLPYLPADRKYKNLVQQKVKRSARAYLYHALKRGRIFSALRIIERYLRFRFLSEVENDAEPKSN